MNDEYKIILAVTALALCSGLIGYLIGQEATPYSPSRKVESTNYSYCQALNPVRDMAMLDAQISAINKKDYYLVYKLQTEEINHWNDFALCLAKSK